MTLGFKERPDPEGFPACLACQDPPDHQARRVTEVFRETVAHQELEWKVLRVLRDLMDCQVLLVLVRQDSKGCVVPLGSKDCEEWWEAPDLWVHPDTASFARLYKCRPTEDQARKDELNKD